MIEKSEYKTRNGIGYIIKKFPSIDANYVKALRKKLGLSQTLFAILMRVSNKTVEKWEQGVNPVTNGNAVAMILFDRDPSLVNLFIEENSEWLATHYVDEPLEKEEAKSKAPIQELKLAKAK